MVFTTRKRSKLGDGIKEVYNTGNYGWYSDNSNLADSGDPWFVRGGGHNDYSNAGVFYSNYDGGNVNVGYSSRLVITP